MTTSTIQAVPAVLSLFVYDEVTVSESWGVSVKFGLVIEDDGNGGGSVVFAPTLEEYKRAIGPLASKLTEEEIERAFELSDRLAGVLFDMWRADGKGKVK